VSLPATAEVHRGQGDAFYVTRVINTAEFKMVEIGNFILYLLILFIFGSTGI
jgi:hypothetical protein